MLLENFKFWFKLWNFGCAFFFLLIFIYFLFFIFVWFVYFDISCCWAWQNLGNLSTCETWLSFGFDDGLVKVDFWFCDGLVMVEFCFV